MPASAFNSTKQKAGFFVRTHINFEYLESFLALALGIQPIDHIPQSNLTVSSDTDGTLDRY